MNASVYSLAFCHFKPLFGVSDQKNWHLSNRNDMIKYVKYAVFTNLKWKRCYYVKKQDQGNHMQTGKVTCGKGSYKEC